MLQSLLARCHPLLLVRHRYLVLQLTRRDVQARYKGSVLGMGWALLYPLLILASYTFVFREVFKGRWAGPSDGPATGSNIPLPQRQRFVELLSQSWCTW